MPQARYWGFWTRSKLDILRGYLEAFTTASQSSRETIYLDLFGGNPQNIEKHTGAEFDGSAGIALSVTQPEFTRLRFFELEPTNARGLRSLLDQDFPQRDHRVIAGDCNTEISKVLNDLRKFNWAPTFAFVDPNGPDIHWNTLEALASFKKKGKPKTEIWLLFAAGMFIRELRVDGSATPEAMARIDRMYGSDDWRKIYQARVEERITPGQAREEYVNLMRWRLENVLNYEWTHSLEIFNERNHSIYHMIFATDHAVGDKIMRSMYKKSAREFPRMRQEAKAMSDRRSEEDQGIQTLFDISEEALKPVSAKEGTYLHEQPWKPYGSES